MPKLLVLMPVFLILCVPRAHAADDDWGTLVNTQQSIQRPEPDDIPVPPDARGQADTDDDWPQGNNSIMNTITNKTQD